MSDELAVATLPTLERIAAELALVPGLKSPRTHRGCLADHNAFERWRAGRSLSKLLLEEYATQLRRADRAPEGVNRALAAVRWWARRLGDLAYEQPLSENLQARTAALERRREIVEQASRVTAVGDLRGERQPKGRHIALGELSALIQACAADPSPGRRARCRPHCPGLGHRRPPLGAGRPGAG